MPAGKVVFVTRTISTEERDVLLDEAPAGWGVTFANPDEGEESLARQVADADYLVTFRSGRISSRVIESARRLKLVQVIGQGTEHLPVREAIERGIHVANTGGANALSVAELTMLLILAALRRLCRFQSPFAGASSRGPPT